MTSIRIITRQGKIKTTPSGIEIFEFRFNFILRRKRAIRGSQSFLADVSPMVGSFSSDVSFFADGIRLTTLLTKSMVAAANEGRVQADKGLR